MKIVILGATGRSGSLVLEQALKRGDEVVAYVRNPRGIAANSSVSVAVGRLDDLPALKTAISGADAVLVCLGTRGKRMSKNVDLMQKSMPSIIKAMEEADVPRLVLLSAYGVGDTARTAGWVARVLYKLVVAAVYKDKERSEEMLPVSGLKWTILYPVILTDGQPVDAVEVRPMSQVLKVTGMPKVSRANVARVMLDAVRDDRTVGQKLLVSSKGSVSLFSM